MSGLVVSEKHDGVTHIVLNSPPANAMSSEFMLQLDEAVSQVEADESCRAVIFRSDVKKIFMAGADLKELLGLSEEESKAYFAQGQKHVSRIEELSKPTIAVLNGHTMGGGCELALCCDFRYMVDAKARIGLPEVTLGLLPGAGGTQRLPRLIGRSRTVDLLFRGRTMTGPEALSIGLVDAVFPAETLLEESVKLAEELARGATKAIGEIKKCLRYPFQDMSSRGFAQEVEGIIYLFNQTHDTKEGIRAFNEKRPPKYTGK